MTPEAFSSLRELWYRRLRAAGFRDVETRRGTFVDRNRLAVTLAVPAVVYQAQVEYFDLAERYLAVGEFPTRLELQVWQLHSEGKTVREIAKALLCSKSTAHRVVEVHRRAMLSPRG